MKSGRQERPKSLAAASMTPRSGTTAPVGHEDIALHDTTGGTAQRGATDNITVGAALYARLRLDQAGRMADTHSAALTRLHAGDLVHHRAGQAAGNAGADRARAGIGLVRLLH